MKEIKKHELEQKVILKGISIIYNKSFKWEMHAPVLAMRTKITTPTYPQIEQPQVD